MKTMTMKSLRGASPSKVVQLFPDVLQEASALGRWTTKKTFLSHYQAPVELVSENDPPPDSLKSNVQHVLRWGFSRAPPANVTAEECMKGPSFWVGKNILQLGKIHSFDGGVCLVKPHGKGDLELHHYELMEAVRTARS
jgi:hypothetical protein